MQKVNAKKILISALCYSLLLSVVGLFFPVANANNLFFTHLGAAKVGTFDIGAGGSDQTATGTFIEFYSSTDCANGSKICSAGTPGGAGFDFTHSSQVNVSAAGVYTLLGSGEGEDCNPGSIHSVQVRPSNGQFTYIFTSFDQDQCFRTVTCANNACTGAANSNVTLIN